MYRLQGCESGARTRVPVEFERRDLDHHRDTMTAQKFLGSPNPRRAMMFFWISLVPPPIVSTTV